MSGHKIKIVHVYKDFNVYNGLIEILTILASGLDYGKFDLGVCVFRYDTNSFGEAFKRLGGKIFSLGISDKLFKEPRETLALYRFFKEYKPDIVQTHVLKANLLGIIAARMAGVPIVIGTEMTLKDTAPSVLRRLRDRLIHPTLSMCIRHCDKFVVTSEFIRREWDREGVHQHFEVIYPPFNLEKYNTAISKTKDNHSSVGNRIGFVGRLSEEKGIDTLLAAMSFIVRESPDSKLILVGTGPLEAKLKKLTDTLQLNSHVHFAGFRENVFEALKDMDVFVLPSRTEGCPIVVLEAMAMGLPIVATRVGGTPELVRDGETAILVPYNDPKKLAEAILSVSRDKDVASQLGSRAKIRVFDEFHPSKFVSRLENLYQQLYLERGMLRS